MIVMGGGRMLPPPQHVVREGSSPPPRKRRRLVFEDQQKVEVAGGKRLPCSSHTCMWPQGRAAGGWPGEADLGGSFHLSRGEGGFQGKCSLASWLAGWRGQSVQAVQV